MKDSPLFRVTKTRSWRHSGFTIMELLVAVSMTSLIMSLLVGTVLFMHDGYHTDMVRTQINGNLRSGLDVLSMNIRQAGENLQSAFPAVVLENGTEGAADVLKLRRNKIKEVLALCQDISAGTTSLPVSRNDLSVSQCVNSNVQGSWEAFQTARNDDGGSTRIFIFDLSSRDGEFLDYTADSFASSVYTLTTSAVSNAYSALTTAIYVLEEYRFAVNLGNNTLTLEFEGDATQDSTVAFDVTDLDVTLLMDDDTEIEELLEDDGTYDWKDIQLVEVTLSGSRERKGIAYSTSLSATYFPRNVLSYDG
ncbi:MAG: hypothetical protein KDD64_01750 [Bdellovibrionales bacterium]|nr:hypothetical protein [Bdellovibrionales bacterium]